MIQVETQDMFANDRGIIFTSEFYPKEMKKQSKRLHPDFHLIFWENIAKIAAATGRKMLASRTEAYKYANNGLGITPTLQSRLDSAKKAIDCLSGSKRCETVINNINQMQIDLERIAPSVDSKYYKGYMAKITAMKHFTTRQNIERLKNIEFDAYTPPKRCSPKVI